MSILDIIIFYSSRGELLSSAALFQQETFVGGVYFGRTFPSGLGCGNVYFRNVCE